MKYVHGFLRFRLYFALDSIVTIVASNEDVWVKFDCRVDERKAFTRGFFVLLRISFCCFGNMLQFSAMWEIWVESKSQFALRSTILWIFQTSIVLMITKPFSTSASTVCVPTLSEDLRFKLQCIGRVQKTWKHLPRSQKATVITCPVFS